MTVISKKDIQFMKMCIDSSKTFSTCGKKQYAAMLVDEYNHIVGFGYNGGPRGFLHCNEGGCKRFLENSNSGSVYDNCIAIHAEANALLHSDYSSRPKKIYVNGPPCFSCAKLIANSTLDTVYYLYDSDYKNWEDVESFLSKANVQTIRIDNGSF
jgi:dCMP deaminase